MNYIGRIIKTTEDDMVIKSAKYIGLATGPNMEVVKKLLITTQCNSSFNIIESELLKVMQSECENNGD
jgi:hypothetical protein